MQPYLAKQSRHKPSVLALNIASFTSSLSAGTTRQLRLTCRHTMPSQKEEWLRASPNTRWQNLENQKFIDLTQIRSTFLDEDRYNADSEEEDIRTTEGTSDTEASNYESECEISDEEDEAEIPHNFERVSFNAPGVAGQGNLKPRLIYDCQPNASRCQDGQAGNTDHGFVGQKDNVVEQFLWAREDEDLHWDSIARLERFFEAVSLEDVEQATVDFGECRILLEDRSYSRKTFRPYPRSLTPKQLYGALGKQVGRSSHVYLLD